VVVLVPRAEALRAMRVRMPVVRMVMRVLVRLRVRMGMAHPGEIYGGAPRRRARGTMRADNLGG
jgi:hypothetical protein